MPGFNKKGPKGAGPRSGKNLGKCHGEAEQNHSDKGNHELLPQGRGRFSGDRKLACCRGRRYKKRKALSAITYQFKLV